MAEDNMVGTLKQQLWQIFETSLNITMPDDESTEPEVDACKGKFGDYQCTNAMTWAKAKGKSNEDALSLGQEIVKNLPESDMVKSFSVAGAGYVNIVLSDEWMGKSLLEKLNKGIRIWAAPKLAVSRAVVDFSSPNIAKELHVGHLRSTVIGDFIATILEYSNVEVLRRNHVGDWGTQFGMLLAYIFEELIDWENATIKDLQAFYKASKSKFDADGNFKDKAQQAVVLLQGGDPKYRQAWATICEVSRKEFEKVYQSLGVSLEEMGESFYNQFIPEVLEGLSKQGLIQDVIKKDKIARAIPIEGENIVVVKSGGGYTYDTTDLTALWYRLNKEKAEWIIYVTDAGQSRHFELIFEAAKRAGWLPADKNLYPKTSHVKFGLVLGADNKRFRTRSTDVVPLVDLLNEAKTRCQAELVKRAEKLGSEWTPEELEQTAQALGYGAVKYADLKNNIETDYKYNVDQMLNDKGDTAVYLMYTYTRACSIIKRSGKDIEELKKTGNIELGHANERALALHLLQFAEAVEEACLKLAPNVLCQYLYKLAEHFSKFCSNRQCQVVGSEQETSRLLLCEATKVVMEECFHLLGLVPIDKI